MTLSMPKRLTRIVSILLVPSLIATTAWSSDFLYREAGNRSALALDCPFVDQALALRPVSKPLLGGITIRVWAMAAMLMVGATGAVQAAESLKDVQTDIKNAMSKWQQPSENLKHQGLLELYGVFEDNSNAVSALLALGRDANIFRSEHDMLVALKNYGDSSKQPSFTSYAQGALNALDKIAPETTSPPAAKIPSPAETSPVAPAETNVGAAGAARTRGRT